MGAIFLAFNQDIAPGRVGMIVAIMGCIGALAAALLIWAIGVISKTQGFGIPFVMIGVLAALGLLPVLFVHWDGEEVFSPRTRETSAAEVAVKGEGHAPSGTHPG